MDPMLTWAALLLRLDRLSTNRRYRRRFFSIFAHWSTPAATETSSRSSQKITEDEIKDKSKSDFFPKAIAIPQLAWMAIQTAARGAGGLAVSQLEIAVLAYTDLASITFCLCLSKPKDVKVLTQVPARESSVTATNILRKDKRHEVARLRPLSWFKVSFQMHGYTSQSQVDTMGGGVLNPMPNDGRYSREAAQSIVSPRQSLLTSRDDGFLLAGVVFGDIHCVVWNEGFPTEVERQLWRIASLVITGVLPLYYA